MHVHCGTAFGSVEQVGHCESIYWECVWFGGTGGSL